MSPDLLAFKRYEDVRHMLDEQVYQDNDWEKYFTNRDAAYMERLMWITTDELSMFKLHAPEAQVDERVSSKH